MNDNAKQNALGQINAQEDSFDFDALEAKLEADLEENLYIDFSNIRYTN